MRVGIIDYLREWRLFERVEHMKKTLVRCLHSPCNCESSKGPRNTHNRLLTNRLEMLLRANAITPSYQYESSPSNLCLSLTTRCSSLLRIACLSCPVMAWLIGSGLVVKKLCASSALSCSLMVSSKFKECAQACCYKKHEFECTIINVRTIQNDVCQQPIRLPRNGPSCMRGRV